MGRSAFCAERFLALPSGLKARFFVVTGWGWTKDDMEEVQERRALPLPFEELGLLMFWVVEEPEPGGLVLFLL